MNPTLVRRAGAVVLVTAAAAALTACDGGTGAQLTFNDIVKTKIDKIVLDGTSGDVQVSTAPGTETRITRLVHSNSDPEPSYSVTGSRLDLRTDCGPRCRVSYRIEVPAGAAVSGRLGSGDLTFDGVSTVDVALTSGDILVRNATGAVQARATSGDVTVSDSKGPVTLEATSGDVRALGVTGNAAIKATSGDITVQLAAPASVTATATSGDVRATVPAGPYQVHTSSSSGDARVLAGVTADPSSKNVLNLIASSGDVTVASAPAA
jgi:DUF4097 and DUF4098 domain-containing protein YvlB